MLKRLSLIWFVFSAQFVFAAPRVRRQSSPSSLAQNYVQQVASVQYAATTISAGNATQVCSQTDLVGNLNDAGLNGTLAQLLMCASICEAFKTTANQSVAASPRLGLSCSLMPDRHWQALIKRSRNYEH
jgi:hypothetical protein